VTSPNEPGHPGPGDSPNGTGANAPAAPRKRPPGRPSPAQQRQPGRGPAPNAEARLNRFISGTAAPGAAKAPAPEADKAPTQNESRETDAYASELPDLSGPIPRAGQWNSAADRADEPMTAPVRSEGRIQVSSRTPGPVRASMQIRRVDPWSTLKVSAVLSVALFFIWMIAVAFLYLVLGGMGVWSKLNSNVGDLLNNTGGGGTELVSSGTIFGGAILIGLVNIVLLTAAATIGAFIYNLTTDLIGGVEVTLADRD
jgi:Transmembrane domain of unknown function (DUF3566)